MDLKRFFAKWSSVPMKPKSTPSDMEVAAMHTLASTLFSQGRYDEALVLFDKVLAADPTRAGAWADKATCVGMMGDPEAALELYDRALELDPSSAAAWMGKGNRLQDLGRPEEAIRCHAKALEIEPEKKEALVCMGLCLADLGQYALAIDCYRKAATIDQRYTAAWLNLGVALESIGESDMAIRAYGFASQTDPGEAMIWHNRGRLEESRGLKMEATRSYRWVLRLAKPGQESFIEHAEGRLKELEGPLVFSTMNEALRLGDAGDDESALRLLEAVLAEDPDHIVALYYRGGVQEMLELHESAVESFGRVVALDPENARAWNLMASELNKLGRHAEALDAANRGVEANRWLWDGARGESPPGPRHPPAAWANPASPSRGGAPRWPRARGRARRRPSR